MTPRLVLTVFTLLLTACSKPEAGSGPSGSAAASSSAPRAAPAFDVEGFCEKAMGVGRPCSGDDELMEGNKIGLCTTQLRAARDDERVKLDASAADECLADVKGAKPPLPDVRTLKTLAERFETCRDFAKQLPTLGDVKPAAVGTVKAGVDCETHGSCVHGSFCDQATKKCSAQKKARQACGSSSECLGRCSRKDGNKCVSYCGSG